MPAFAYLLVCLTLAMPMAAVAAVFTVDSTVDAVDAVPGDGICASAGGDCTLRAAVMEANGLPGADEIDLPAGTYLLAIGGSGENESATGDLDIADDLAIAGEGAATTTIAGSGDRVFQIISSAVAIAGVSITNGSRGGVANHGNLTIRDAVVSENTATNICGKGLCPGTGGGIYNYDSGTLLLVRTTIRDNSTSPKGPVCCGPFGCWFCPNGSAVFNDGVAMLHECTITGNSGYDAVANFGQLIIVGSTVSGNSVDVPFVGPVSIQFGTIVHQGEGLFIFGPGRVRATILEVDSSCGGVVDEGGNMESGDTCGLDPTISWVNTDPILGPLQDNGGPTWTHALLAGSPAIDAIPLDDCTWDDDGDPNTPQVELLHDQRGVERPHGASCDIGAVEQDQLCGNAVVEAHEECDDGNTESFDGCDSACRLECGNGSLEPGEACDDGNALDGDGCSAECIATYCTPSPAPGCLVAEKASLRIDERRVGKEKIKADLRKIAPADFGDPLAGTTYDICLYDQNEALRGVLHVDRDGDDCGRHPCWTVTPRRIKYTDHEGASDGVRKMAVDLRSGELVIRAKNRNSRGRDAMPAGMADALDGHTSATVQLVTSDAACVEATLGNVTKADGSQFKAKAR